MTEEQWLTCPDPNRLIGFLSDCAEPELGLEKTLPPDGRRFRLFAAGCCRRIEHFLTDSRSLQALAVLERYLDGNAAEADREAANRAAELVQVAEDPARRYAAEAVCHALFSLPAYLIAEVYRVSVRAAHAAGCAVASPTLDERAFWNAVRAEETAQADLLREIFGNHFRPVSFSPSWRTDTALSLARQMYEARDFSAMPILADALQDAGCDSAELLDHLRDTGALHVRGCWALDLVLGKE
jgi:hypothetical protein